MLFSRPEKSKIIQTPADSGGSRPIATTQALHSTGAARSFLFSPPISTQTKHAPVAGVKHSALDSAPLRTETVLESTEGCKEPTRPQVEQSPVLEAKSTPDDPVDVSSLSFSTESDPGERPHGIRQVFLPSTQSTPFNQYLPSAWFSPWNGILHSAWFSPDNMPQESDIEGNTPSPRC